MAINAQEIQGQWNKLRGKVKEKWGQLTDDDLTIQGGNVDQMVGRIQQRTGEGREAIEKFFGELTAKGAAGLSGIAETARDYAANAGEYAQQGYEYVAGQVQQGYESGREIVRNNPAQSLAAAFGVGAVLGLVFGLALRSR